MADAIATSVEDSSLFQVLRISRKGSSALIKRANESYAIVSLETGKDMYPTTTSFDELSAKDSWRKVTSDEVEALTASIESSSMDIMTEGPEKSIQYRVPPAVKVEIAAALSNAEGFSKTDIQHATSLAFNDAVGLPDIEWVRSFFDQYDDQQRLRGGYKGQKWASKILAPQNDDDYFGEYDDDPVDKQYDFDDDTFAYYAIGATDDSTIASDLMAIDFETGVVYIWGPDGFDILDGQQIDDVEAPQLILIDEQTAEALARWIDSETSEPFDVLDADPVERNLFTLAESSLDFEDLDRRTQIITAAAGVDIVPNQYTPEERSINATRQIRGPGGKFGGAQIKPGIKLLGYTKARLPAELPLVANPAGRIQEWLASAPVTAAATSVTNGAANPNPAPQPDPAAAAPQAEATAKATQPDESKPILYFAIVDNADKTAVLNAVAITKDDTGQPQAWLRENAAWQSSPATLEQLTGATPPPVVELTVPEPAKTILGQIDQHDSSKEQFPTDAIPNSQPAAAPAAAPAPVAASAAGDDAALRGYSLPDGTCTIYDAEDLSAAVANFASFADGELAAKRHIRKRARALNRMDLVPADWREFSVAEQGEVLAMQTPLYSEFGELLPSTPLLASANPGKDAESTERLMRYWAEGEGAAKIRWGTKGDLTRAHRHLAKYVGPGMAWGLAQNLHERVFGMSNIKHDKLTGQYEGHGRHH